MVIAKKESQHGLFVLRILVFRFNAFEGDIVSSDLLSKILRVRRTCLFFIEHYSVEICIATILTGNTSVLSIVKKKDTGWTRKDKKTNLYIERSFTYIEKK